MRNILIFLSIVTAILSLSCGSDNRGYKIADDDIIIENEQFRLVVGADAISKSLILKATGEECLMQGEGIALFSATQERPYHNEIKLSHPNKRTVYQANSLKREGDKLVVGFELILYRAVIELNEKSEYVSFKLYDFITENIYPSYLKITPPPASEIALLQLPLRDRENFGEWLNVSWDSRAAINVLATDEFAYIDFEKRNGYNILRASAVKDIKLEGTGAALIVSPTELLLDNIAQLEEDFNLPRGVESRRNDLINASYYWTAAINPNKVDEHIKYAKMGGFRLMNIYYPGFEKSNGYRLIGNYEIDKNRYPDGKADLAKMLDRIKDAGIIPGVHFLHSHIGRDSRYVTPVPDYRLNVTRRFNLAADLTRDDTTIYVEQNPEGSTMADGTRVLRVGTELISYRDYTTTHPYRFTGCERGIDKTTINSQAKGAPIDILDISEFGATSVYIDQRTGLQDEVAEKMADIYDAGFEFIYFDGSEGVNPPFGHYVPLAQYKVFKRLKPTPLFAEGAAKSHFSWHMLSGGNAFDLFAPEMLKEETRNWPAQEASQMRKDFTRINFGWLGYWAPSENSVGTQPDMLEYVTGVAAGWDCPVSLHSNLHLFKTHPRTADNLEVLRRWEEVRAQHWLTEKDKLKLQNLNQEHHLLLNEEGEYELVPYRQILNVANGNREVRAFIFERKGEYYVTYWHISGEKLLELDLNAANVQLYDSLDRQQTITSNDKNSITVPVDNRRYLKISNIAEEHIIKVFEKATIIEYPG